MPPGPARFWGLVVIVADLVGIRARLAPHVGEIRDAVQPGRQIATLVRGRRPVTPDRLHGPGIGPARPGRGRLPRTDPVLDRE